MGCYGYIYMVTDLLNKHNLPRPFYVGQKIGDFNSSYFGSGDMITSAVRKYGKENFTVKQLDIASNKTELSDLERTWIKNIDCMWPNGYNLSPGGDAPMLGRHHRVDSKLNIKLHNAKHWLGKPKTIEVRNKISETKLRMLDEGTIVPSFLGKKHTSESKEIMRSKKIGKKLTASTINKLKLYHSSHPPSNIIQWKVINPKGDELIVSGLYKFCKKHKLSQPHMHSVAAGKRPHHKGWKCEKVTKQ
jgi:group I intron endonuclease